MDISMGGRPGSGSKSMTGGGAERQRGKRGEEGGARAGYKKITNGIAERDGYICIILGLGA